MSPFDSDCDVFYPRGVLAPERLPGVVAYPSSWIYRRLSSWARRRGLARRPAPSPDTRVVSIGNLEVGGNGKTPFSVYALARLRREGQRPVYLSRGYGSVAERLDLTTVVQPAGGGAIAGGSPVRWVDRSLGGLSQRVGDEGAVVAARCPDVPLLFDRDRRRGIATAVECFHPTHVILDDAFQSWGVGRHVDIVLLDAERPFGNGRILPAGTLREKPAALQRADIVGINGVTVGAALSDYEGIVERACGVRRPVFGVIRRVTLTKPDGSEPNSPDRVAALSSIARPEHFDASLRDVGLDVALSIRYPDHYRYSGSDVEHIRGLLASRSVAVVVTTEKDWVKLGAVWHPNSDIVVARLSLDLVGADESWVKIAGSLSPS